MWVSLQAAVIGLNDFITHYFERKGVESAGKKWEDVREQMEGTVNLLDSLQGKVIQCVAASSASSWFHIISGMIKTKFFLKICATLVQSCTDVTCNTLLMDYMEKSVYYCGLHSVTAQSER